MYAYLYIISLFALHVRIVFTYSRIRLFFYLSFIISNFVSFEQEVLFLFRHFLYLFSYNHSI